MKKIFVLEKNKDILDIISIVLGEEGFKVREVTTLKELELLLQDDPPDAILIDVISSLTHEADFCRKLKSSERTASIPLIVLSTDNKVKTGIGESCADHFIAKPFNIEDLVGAVSSRLSL